MKYRIETDTIGEVKVPESVYWGPQTERSRQNFKIGTSNPMPIEIIYGYAHLKKSAAMANHELGILEKNKKDLIVKVCDEIIEGKLDDHFPLVIWQTGSGTQTNMNINEVISNRAHVILGNKLGAGKKELSPNDDVNMSQSSNDTFPTSIHIATYLKIKEVTIPGVENLLSSLKTKAKEFEKIVKIGRTHLMDATPVTLGQEFSGYSSLIEYGLDSLKFSLNHLSEIALGGTAVGTGINTPNGYNDCVANYISESTNIKFVTAKNKFEAISSNDAVVGVHSSLKQLAISLNKIANDIRLMGSGPRSGIGEIYLPANEPGSSIMPGKVNPTQCEALTMVCAQVMGNDVAIGIGDTQGHFELNVFRPLVAKNIMESCQILGDACKSFSENCISGIKPNLEKIDELLNNSLMLITALNTKIGYYKSAEIANFAFKENISLKEAAVKLNYVSEEDFDKWVKPEDMTGNDKN